VEVAGPCGRGAGVVGPRGRGAGGGPTWRRAVDRGGVDHHAEWTELIMYCIYEYKYTKYLIDHADWTEMIMYCIYAYKYTKYLIEHK
jgi:hypothetical protein